MFKFVRANRLLFMTIGVALLAGVGYALSGRYGWLKTVANALIVVQAIVVASLIIWRVVDALRFGVRGVDIISVSAILVALWARSYWMAMALCLAHLFIFALRSFVDARVNAVAGLPDSDPDSGVIVLRGRKQVSTTVDKLSKGDKILVEANSVIPVDGILVDDKGEVDESWLNGNASVSKSKHDVIRAGSINRSNALTIKSISSRSGSLVSSLAHTHKSARFTSSSFLSTAEMFTLVYTLVVIVFGVGAFIRGDKLELLATLVAATPLVFIATPRWFFAIAMNTASKHGIFFKSNKSVELASVIKNLLLSDTFVAHFGKKSDEFMKKLNAYVDNISVLGSASNTKKSKYVHVINANSLSEKIISIEKAPDNSSVLSLSPDTEHSLLQASELGIQLGSSLHGLSEAADIYILDEDTAKVGATKAIAKDMLRRCQMAILIISLVSIGVMFGAAYGYINAWYALAANSVIYLMDLCF